MARGVTGNGGGRVAGPQARAFEPFLTAKGPGKGAGLDLATVYGSVTRGGGGISVETRLGRGSTLRIYLPLELAPVDPTQSQLPPPVEKTVIFLTIPVVADEEIVRAFVCDVLIAAGCDVLCAAAGHEALRRAAACDGPIHLLLRDAVIPPLPTAVLPALPTPPRP